MARPRRAQAAHPCSRRAAPTPVRPATVPSLVLTGVTAAGRPIFGSPPAPQPPSAAPAAPQPAQSRQPAPTSAVAPQQPPPPPPRSAAAPVIAGRFAAPPPGASQAASAAWANLLAARDLGLIEALVPARSADRWDAVPSDDELLRLARLRCDVEADAAVANAVTYHSELANALTWAGIVKAAFPSRPLVVRRRDAGDSAFNAESKAIMFKVIRDHGSIKRGHEGEQIKANSISGIISTFFAFAGRLAGQQRLIEDGDEVLYQATKKRALGQDGAPGQRRAEDPLRAQHLRAALSPPAGRDASSAPLESSSPVGIVRKASLLGGHNLLARAKDLMPANPEAGAQPGVDLVIAAFDWDAAAQMQPPALVIWLRPSKDPTQRKPRYPMLVQRRSSFADAPRGSDPMCTFDALSAAWEVLAAPVPRELWAQVMFFRVPDRHTAPQHWRPLTERDVTAWVKQAAEAAGVSAANRASRALRMGGAADLYDLYGPAAERYIRERGRWASDVAQIYQCVSASVHGALSRTIGDSVGQDLQSMLAGWRKLAVSHGRCRL